MEPKEDSLVGSFESLKKTSNSCILIQNSNPEHLKALWEYFLLDEVLSVGTTIQKDEETLSHFPIMADRAFGMSQDQIMSILKEKFNNWKPKLETINK